MEDCVFCDIVAGRSPAKFLHPENWPYVVIFEPLNPVTPGHVLVVPRMHVTDFTDHEFVTGETAKMAAKYARSVGGPFNMITSKGREATQSVYHLHIHLVPRRKDDGLALPWYSGKGNHG